MNHLDYMHRQGRPTILQIQYMEELNMIPKKRGAISQIAEKCKVNHAAVSRFLNSCRESGYLDRNYEFTESGQIWLEQYTKSREAAFLYFMELGMTRDEATANANILIENFDLHTISLITGRKKKKEIHKFADDVPSINISQIIKKGKFQVSFQLFQCDRLNRNKPRLSMADQGFEKPAILVKNNRGVFLNLTIKEIQACSKLTDEFMTGYLTSLKYEENGYLMKAEIRNRIVKLPLDAFKINMLGEGRCEAILPVILTGSVGRKHMPESRATLVLWL